MSLDPARPTRWALVVVAASLASATGELACGTTAAPSPFATGPSGQGGSGGGADVGATGSGGEADETLGGPCTVDAQCDDGVACTLDACELGLSRCRHLPDDSVCQDALVCNGEERCDVDAGCSPGAPKTCTDGNPCTIDTCDEATNSCKTEPRDADADGDPDVHCGGGDCDDGVPLVSSLQSEVCANAIDDDCDGVVDEAGCGAPMHDDCFDPLEAAAPGTYAMSTVAAKADYASSCPVENSPAARDVVAAVSVPTGLHDVQLTVRTELADAAVALFGQCGPPGPEAACSRGFPHPQGGRVAKLRARSVGDAQKLVLPAIVSSDSAVPITLRYELLAPTTAPANETCGTAAALADGVPQTASLPGTKVDLETACGGDTGELVYRFELTEPRDVDLFAASVDGDGSPVLSLRNESCALATDELTCALAPSGAAKAHLYRRALPAGVHHVAVSASAPTDVLVTLATSSPTSAPPDESCVGAPTLVPGATVDVPLLLHQDDVDTGCLPGGVDAAYSLELSTTSDVLVVGRYASGDAAAVALAEKACGPQDGVACAVGYVSPTRARAHGLAKGSYRVLAESQGSLPMQLTAFVRPSAPPVVVPFSDACADALTIPPTGGLFKGTTKNAKPDFPAGCDQGNQPPKTAADQLFRLELGAPKRVVFDMQGSGYATVLVVREGPGCPGKDLPQACAAGYYPDRSFLDLTLAAGTYYVQVDGFAGQSGPWFLDVFTAEPTN
ncbi:MAG: putative metal-binding motif-containing protein [Deltaproteobacteria bacterium]|nr:putative metal-binding motif-containing protein [Deltaproteobacteria bacterium]